MGGQGPGDFVEDVNELGEKGWDEEGAGGIFFVAEEEGERGAGELAAALEVDDLEFPAAAGAGIGAVEFVSERRERLIGFFFGERAELLDERLEERLLDMLLEVGVTVGVFVDVVWDEAG